MPPHHLEQGLCSLPSETQMIHAIRKSHDELAVLELDPRHVHLSPSSGFFALTLPSKIKVPPVTGGTLCTIARVGQLRVKANP